MIDQPNLIPAELSALRDFVIDLWCCGMDTQEISEEVGYSEAWVHREIGKYLDGQIAAGLKERKT